MKLRPNLVFSGQLGSGKTCVSKAVAEVLGFRWNSFGSTLKVIAAEQGLSITRENLQALGEEMVAVEGEELCCRVLAHPKTGESRAIVIDGLRHLHIRDELQRLTAPLHLALIYVDTPEMLRRERLRIRDGLNDAEIDALERHSTEIQVATEIRQAADYVADNSGDIRQTVSAIVEWVQAL